MHCWSTCKQACNAVRGREADHGNVDWYLMVGGHAMATTAKSEPRIVRYFLAAGFLVPCMLYAVILIGDLKLGGVWAWILLVPWPTIVLLMSAEAGGGIAGQALAFLISAGANVAVYGLLGAIASFCYRRFFAVPSDSPTRAA
jgi:hypothetical protein